MSELWITPVWATVPPPEKIPDKAKEERAEQRRRQRLLKTIFPNIVYSSRISFLSVYDKEGNYEATYAGERATAEALGLKSYASVEQVLRGLSRTAGGKQIRKADIVWIDGKPTVNRKNIGPIRERTNPKPPIAVSVYDLDGYYLTTFDSMKKASEILGVPQTHISAAISGRTRRQAGGFLFRKAKKDTSFEDGRWNRHPITPYKGPARMRYLSKDYNELKDKTL